MKPMIYEIIVFLIHFTVLHEQRRLMNNTQVLLRLIFKILDVALVFRRKDLCERKHDARVRNFVSNFGIFLR